MRNLLFSLVVPALLVAPATAAAGELKFSLNGGLVTLVADDVPLAEILAEWARVGQTKIVNGEQIFTRVTLHIENTPEKKALDIVLRSAAGYMAAERVTPVAGGSAFDSIMILPTSRAPAGSPIMSAPPAPFAPRPVVPVPDVDDDMPMGAVPPGMNAQPVPGDPTQQQPPAYPGQPFPGQPQVQPQPGQPQAPLTAPRPGMLVPPPQQPVPFGAPRPGMPTPNMPGGPGGVPNPNLPGGGGGGGGQ